MATDVSRITVNLIPDAADDLDYLTSHLRLGKTDVVNKALTMMAYWKREAGAGRQWCLYDPDRDEYSRIIMT